MEKKRQSVVEDENERRKEKTEELMLKPFSSFNLPRIFMHARHGTKDTLKKIQFFYKIITTFNII